MANCGDLYTKLSEKTYNPTPGEIGEAITCLRDDIKELQREFRRLSKEGKTTGDKLNLSFGNVGKTITGMVKGMGEFYVNLKQQYQLAEQLAESYKRSSITLGLSIDRSEEFSMTFKKGAARIAEFGGELGDVERIYENFTDESGRSRIISPEDVENIFKLSKSTGLIGTEAAEMYETFDLMGKSLSDVNREMETLIKETQSIGLNSSKVIGVLSSNLKNMQTYSFVNGVKGMTEMAKQAVKMRVDVSDILSMADKFYQPEAAIEAAAQLQLLGGDIAAAFGDPFTVMYEARNKPEELAKRVQKMTENMIQFNEESGEYELPAEARMQLKAVGDQLGLNINSMVEMTRQGAKMKDIKMQLSGSMFSEEEIEGIANMAKVKDGEFKVDIFDPKTGDRIEKSLDELGKGDVEMLLKAPKDEEDYMEQMVFNSMTTNQLLTSLNEKSKLSFIAEVGDVYKIQEEAFLPVIDTLREFDNEMLSAVKQIPNLEENLKYLTGTSDKQIEILNKQIKALGKTTKENVETFLSQDFKELYENVGESMEKFTEKVNETLEDGVDTLKNKLENLFDKKMKVEGVEPTEKKEKLPYQEGKTMSPQEAVRGGLVQNVRLTGNPTIDVNIKSDNENIKFKSEEVKMVSDAILKSILSIFNNGGSIDGGNQSQNSKGFEQNLGNYKKT